MTRTWPIVVRLKNAKSSGRCQGMSGPLPMTPFRATAAISVTSVKASSDRDRGLDGRVCVVPHQLEVLQLELVESGARRDPHLRQWPRIPRQLEPGLVEVVEVQVRVAERVD